MNNQTEAPRNAGAFKHPPPAFKPRCPDQNCPSFPDSTGRPLMKTLAAALIAAAILIVVDDHYNDGRYTQVLQQAVTSLLPG
jgi:hypothetical protein